MKISDCNLSLLFPSEVSLRGSIVASAIGDAFHHSLGYIFLKQGAGSSLLISTKPFEALHVDGFVALLGEVLVECHVERLGIGGFEAGVVNLVGHALGKP